MSDLRICVTGSVNAANYDEAIARRIVRKIARGVSGQICSGGYLARRDEEGYVELYRMVDVVHPEVVEVGGDP